MNVIVDVGLLSTTVDITCNYSAASDIQSAGITVSLVTTAINIGYSKCARGRMGFISMFLDSYGACALNTTLTVGTAKYLINCTTVNLDGNITALTISLYNVCLSLRISSLVTVTATEYLTNCTAPYCYVGTKHIGCITTAIYNAYTVVATINNNCSRSDIGRIVVSLITAAVDLGKCVT